MAKKIIAFYELEPWEKKYIKKKLKSAKSVFIDGTLNEKTVGKAKKADMVATFIYSEVNKKVLAKLPRVKLVTTMSTGFDHIDLKEAKKRKITVCNVPSYGVNTVAEHGFAMLLSLSRRLNAAQVAAREAKVDYRELRGFDLKGKTMGILGTGRIGQHMIRMAKGFEMNVIGWDKFPNKKMAKELGFKYVKSVGEVLKKSDVLSLHLPLLDSTKHIINKKNIKKLKKGCVLINTARGGLIDTEALLEGLENGRIAAAGIDVLEEEAIIKDEKELLYKIHNKKANVELALEEHMLMHRANVIITPHNAFNTTEALERILDTTVENINAFVKKKPVNLVKLK